MHPDIQSYNNKQTAADGEICDLLAGIIDQELTKAESKIWNAHPVWFLDGNPIVGYRKKEYASCSGAVQTLMRKA